MPSDTPVRMPSKDPAQKTVAFAPVAPAPAAEPAPAPPAAPTLADVLAAVNGLGSAVASLKSEVDVLKSAPAPLPQGSIEDSMSRRTEIAANVAKQSDAEIVGLRRDRVGKLRDPNEVVRRAGFRENGRQVTKALETLPALVTIVPKQDIPNVRIGPNWYSFKRGVATRVPQDVYRHLAQKGVIGQNAEDEE